MKPMNMNQSENTDHVVLEGNALYEIDEECVRRKRQNKKRRAAMEKKHVKRK